MKRVKAVCFILGAFAWPYTAGLLLGGAGVLFGRSAPMAGFCAAVLLFWSFVAWWRGYKWLRSVLVSMKRGVD